MPKKLDPNKIIFQITIEDLLSTIKIKGLDVELTEEIANNVGQKMSTNWDEIEDLLRDYENV